MLFLEFKKEEIKEFKKVDPTLLWEYDLDNFNYQEMRNIVVQRVIERGRREDFYTIFNLYGEDGVIEAIKQISYLNDKNMNFVSVMFQIPLNDLKCYKKKLSNPGHWNS